ncbi:helicase C-terminal domain-containing protein [Candidatus Villigracilis affinis]|uniref:helicase C-terminal domain-containing protein n=2 Tax=Candidatus Villigracilis affinis TaxID=3140682 RepID=UPI002A227BC5|nr:DEAD/DEAH box helicase family protein [Anaerolineales bacterium]
MTTIVSLDIETTGLDENREAIIEIAAVKFNGRRIENEFNTLINPGKHIPEFITGLTGIDDAMVRQAPRLRDIAHELTAFVGDAPILGHNVKFDIGFLRKAGLFEYQQTIDTYELASVLMPTASRYNLGSLGQQLNILLPATHRALDDARVTQAAYVRLFEMACELPLEILNEIVQLGDFVDWDASWVFQQALKNRSKETPKAKRVKIADFSGPMFESAKKESASIQKTEEPIPLDPEEIAAVLEYGGPFSQYFESYEHRPEQVEMLKAVTNALSTGNHLMVEAGTGVGKSFAYLVPAAYFAVQNHTRVVVSTNTINLQDQLIKKDIPNLKAALNLEVNATVMKGRGNYLCPRKLEYMRSHGPKDANEMRVLAKIMVWMLDNASGDRNELNLTGPTEREAWSRLSAEDDNCTTETCMGRMGGSCPFQRAKQAALNSHILIVNHALLLSDVASGSKVLPEYDYVIIDEAHHMESAVTGALSFRLTQNDLERMMKELGGSSAGILGRILTDLHSSLRPSDFGLLQQKIKRATDQAFRVEQLAKQFFMNLSDFIAIQREGQQASTYSWQMRIIPATRTLPGWDDIEMSWGQVGETMSLLLKTLDELYKGLGDLMSEGHDSVEDIMGNLSSLMRRMTEAEAAASGLMHKPSNELIYWVEVNPRGERLSLNAAPLRVGPLVQKHLWHEKASVIMASATMTTHGEFQYIRNTLSAEEVDTVSLGSPFDYESSTLLYVANDIPEPNVHGYQQALDKTIIATAKATGGRMLVLFTSYAALKKTAQAITGPLAREDIFVFEQGEGASPNALLESFKSTDRAVLLGTRSFWEGVDVPGDSLSVVFITKLPFDVPSDPIIAARSELYEDSFNEYYLPESILKFRQGFGRLIRSASDRGIVAILDRRVLTKQYGRLFLESLPPCTARQGAAAGLAKMAGQWLGL